MADNSSNNSSSSRNWRDRVGVRGEMPKLADEFGAKSKEQTGQPGGGQNPPSRQQSQPQRGGQPASAQQHARQGAPQKPVARAPMAPRRPAAPAVAPQAQNRRQNQPQNQPLNNSSGQSGQGGEQRSLDFAARLRAQREAAEALAAKRAEESRAARGQTAPSHDGPRFSFAEEEVEAATAEQVPAHSGQNPAHSGQNPARAQAPNQPPQAQSAPRNAPQMPPSAFRPANPAAPVNNGSPQSYQPSDAYRQTHGYNETRDVRRDEPTPRQPVQPPRQERYSEPDYEPAGYTPPNEQGFRDDSTRSRGPDPRYIDENADIYDDRGQQNPPSGSRARAGASEYSAAYRDYDDGYEYDEESRKKGGMWIFATLMIFVVVAIAAIAYWFINYGTQIGTNPSGGEKIPTVSAPEQPVKVAPKPVETPAPGTPVRRKKIYDRILGNQTLEPEKLVPSEEAPLAPPAATPQSAPVDNAPLGVEPLPLPLPPPPVVPGVQGAIPQGSGTTAQTNSGGGKSSRVGQTTIAPTSAKSDPLTRQAGGQDAPLPLPGTATASNPIAEPPIPRSKPASVLALAQAAAERTRLAALSQSASDAPSVPAQPRQLLQQGSGPVKIGPGTNRDQQFNAGNPTVPVVPQQPIQPRTTVANLPQPTQPIATPTPKVVTGGYVLQMSSFRNRDAASAEYRRLSSRHASILGGLSPEIQEADLGASGKFYKLRLGSVTDRSQAARLCNSLIAAGEKDCLVRKR